MNPWFTLPLPAVVALRGTLLVASSSHQPNFALWMSTSPRAAWAVSKAKQQLLFGAYGRFLSSLVTFF